MLRTRAGANAAAAVGNAATVTRPDGSRPAADRSASAASTWARMISACTASWRPDIGELDRSRGPVEQRRPRLPLQRGKLL